MPRNTDPVSLYVRHGFHALTHRSVFAVVFLQTFRRWQRRRKRRTLAGFCQLLDPSVPTRADGYRFHPTYQRAERLIRLAQRTRPDLQRKIARKQRAIILRFPVTGSRAGTGDDAA